MIMNNGDFYPRNLIVRPDGRIVIIDWETYNIHSPFHTIDHPENVAAVFYTHMWGNPAWPGRLPRRTLPAVRHLPDQLRQGRGDPGTRTGRHVAQRHRPVPGGHPGINRHQHARGHARPLTHAQVAVARGQARSCPGRYLGGTTVRPAT